MKTILLLLAACLLLHTQLLAAPGDLDPLDANIVGTYVAAVVTQPDGKVILAGSFTSVLGVLRNHIARLNADGTLDVSFDPKASGLVRSVALQPDGKILIAGNFTTLQPNGAPSTTARSRIARLNADGTLDTGFDPKAGGNVYTVVPQPDGEILLGGVFTTLQPNGGALVTRNYIARVHADGTLDTSFNPNASGDVRSIVIQPDDAIVFGGAFTQIGATTRNRIARVSSTGVLDTTFNPNVTGSTVDALALQPDGKVLIGGNFTMTGGTSRSHIARVNAAGSLDTGFDPKAGARVYGLTLQTDGKIHIAGQFTTLQPNGAAGTSSRQRFARLNNDGTLDPGFDPKADGDGYGVMLQADGSAFVMGEFGSLQPNNAALPTTRNRLARLTNDSASQSLTATSASRVLWTRSGAGPETTRVTFELSTNGGSTWSPLGNGTRIGTTADWELTGLSLPATGSIRARGWTAGGLFNAASGFLEQTTPFNFNAADFTYTSNGISITITGYTGSGGVVVIPAMIAGLPVSAIGPSAFLSKSTTSVTIPSGVVSIGESAFSNCWNLTSVVISTTVTSIGAYAFTFCNSLTSVTIPSGVTSIGARAFYYCPKLTSILVEASNVAFASDDGVLFNKSKTLLIQYPGGKSGDYSIPSGVSNIEDSAFYYSRELTSLTIPSSVTDIGNSAFYDCNQLTSVTILSGVTSIGTQAFRKCWRLTSVTIPVSVMSIGDGAFLECTGLTSVTILGGVTYFGESAFSGCWGLTNVTMLPGVTSIGSSAFHSCTSLTNVTLPSSVTNIGHSAFTYCTSLTSVTIPSSVTTIGYDAFSRTGLSSVTIPAGVSSIAYSAFSQCRNLTSILVDAANISFGSVNGVLFNKSGTTLILYPGGRSGGYTIPTGVINVGTFAFYDCTGLTGVTIPPSVTSIRYAAFYYCSMTSLTIPPSVTTIEHYAFSSCAGLASATFNGNAPNLASTAFVDAASGFAVYFYAGATGFTTPTWNGYPTVMLPSNSEITIEQPAGSSLTDGVGGVAFGNRLLGQSQVLSFTIRNDGTTALSGLAATVSGTHSANFVAGTPGALSLSPGEATTFNVTFTPGASGARSASLHIASNDADENPFDIALTGTGLGSVNPVFNSAADVAVTTANFNASGLDLGTLTLGFAPGVGVQLVLVSNTGSSAVIGTFNGLPEGAIVSAAFGGTSYDFQISYMGGDGNDVVLLKTTDPAADFTYTSNGTSITITGYTGNGGAVVIPGMIAGLPVRAIGNSAFYGRNTIASVVIPPSVTSIGESSFSRCFSLASALIPSGVTMIGDRAFEYCDALATMVIPSSVTSIGNGAFSSCTGLTEITISSGVAIIGNLAFNSCSSLAAVIIPGSVASIGEGAFRYCTSLTTVMIPSSVTSMGSNPFLFCSSLTSINVDSANPSFFGSSGVLFNKPQTMLIAYPGGINGSYAIPSGVTEIADHAFNSCAGLTMVAMPSSVTSIGAWAFASCNGLSAVTIPSGVTSIQSFAFSNCRGLLSVTIPSGVASIGSAAFSDCSDLAALTIMTGVTDIQDGAFSRCFSLTAVTIPESVTSIAYGAFSACTGLSAATFRGNAPSLGNSAFANAATGFAIYYYAGATGFTTPTWNGYPTVMLASNSEITVEQPSGSSLMDGVGSIGFGNRLLGQSQVLSFTIHNDGTTALSGLAATVSGTHSADFVAGTPSALSLAPGEATTLNVTFTPGALGARSASLHIASNDADENPFDIALIGTGLGSVNPVFNSAVDVAVTTASFTASGLDLGTLTLGFAPGVGTQLVLVNNTGSNPISGTINGLPDGGITTTTFNGETYRFVADYTGGDGNDLVLTLATPDIAAEVLNGAMIADGGSIDFGTVASGVVAPWKQLILRNVGTGPLEILEYTLDGPDAGRFQCVPFSAAPPATVQPGESFSLMVTCTPPSIDPVSATLVISSNDPDEHPFEIVLSGKGDSLNPAFTSPGEVARSVSSFDATGIRFGRLQLAFQPAAGASLIVVEQTGVGPISGELTGMPDGGYVSATYQGVNHVFQIDYSGGDGNDLVLNLVSPDEFVVVDFDEFSFPDGAVHGIGSPLESGGFQFSTSSPSGFYVYGDVLSSNPGSGAIYTSNAPIVATRAGQAFDLVSVDFAERGFPPHTIVVTGAKEGGGSVTTSVTLNGGTVSTESLSGFGAFTSLTSLELSQASYQWDRAVFRVQETPQAEIVVELAGVGIDDGSSAIDFGFRLLGQPSTRTFTIRNEGTAPLSGLVVSGASGDFTSGQPGESTLDPGESTTFDVIFIPTVAGVRSASLQIASNDADENPFEVNLTGMGEATLTPVFNTPGDVVYTSNGFNAGNFSLAAITLGFAPTPGTQLMVVNNTGAAAVLGTFTGVPEGAILTAAFGGSTYYFQISYVGGNGNDVVLMAITDGAADFTYTSDGNSITITGYTGSSDAIVIPAMIAGLPVATIGYSAFYNRINLTSVTIPSSVTSIESFAFSVCAGLTSMTIPSSVTSIGEYAFVNCSGLTSMTLPSSVTSIGEAAFANCLGLTSVTIYANVTNIEDGLFNNCANLSSVTLPSSVTSIGAGAFSLCVNLTSVTLPSSVTSIGEEAFQNCTRLISVTFNGNAPSLGGLAFADTAPGFTIYHYAGATGFTIPLWNGYPSALIGGPMLAEVAVDGPPGGGGLVDGESSVGFGTVLQGNPSPPQTFTIRNEGSSNLANIAVTVNGTHSDNFQVATVGDLPIPETLSPGQSTSFRVTFVPSAVGPRAASLHIASNDADENPFDVALTGTGLGSINPVFLSPDQIWLTSSGFNAAGVNFGSLALNFIPVPGTVLRVVNNTGSGPITGIVSGLPDGAQVTTFFGGETYTFQASYTGGDGNDLVLSLVTFTDVLIDFGPFVPPPVIGVQATYVNQGVTFSTNSPAGLRIYSENGSPALGMDGGNDMVISAGGAVFSLLGLELASPETVGQFTIVLTDESGMQHTAISQAPGHFDEAQLLNAFGTPVFRNIVSARIFNEFDFGVSLDNVALRIQSAASPSPSIQSLLLPNGDYEITFTGILQSSPDLQPSSWLDVTPPPTSPHVIPKAGLGVRGFFRARGQ